MRSSNRRGQRALAALAAGALAIGLAACGGDDDDSSGDDGGGGSSEETLVFGASADPVILDGAYVSDGESIRVLRQMFEGLVTTEEGGTDIVPALATEWEANDDGTVWTFTLRDGVTFHDGEAFNAEAVCFNFDRWYNFAGVAQSPTVSYYWSTVFGGFANNEDPTLPPSLFASCEASEDLTATITLTSPSASFLSALSLPAFSMGSPKALEEGDADAIGGTGESPDFSANVYGNEAPVGTGPYQFGSWEKGTRLTLEKYDDHWGDGAIISELVFVPIADGPARRQALEAGDIDGYDLVDPADVAALESGGFQILNRPAFNVGYVGMNNSSPPLDDVRVRQAVAHAINKDNILTTAYPEGSEAAINFMPPTLFGWTDTVETYDYDPEAAKALLAEAGQPNPTIEFWYPSAVSRPYMPNPQQNFELMKADLEAVGFTVNTQTAPWNPDYLNAVDSGNTQMWLLGWTGDFGDPDNFVGTFFQQALPSWAITDESLRTALAEAEVIVDQDERTAAYEAINQQISELVPGVPYVHTQPSIAFVEGVEGFVPSPVNNEDFALVSFS